MNSPAPSLKRAVIMPLTIAATLVLAMAALLLIWHLGENRQLLGANHNALMVDVARAQEEAIRLRALLNIRDSDDVSYFEEMQKVVVLVGHRLHRLGDSMSMVAAPQDDDFSLHVSSLSDQLSEADGLQQRLAQALSHPPEPLTPDTLKAHTLTPETLMLAERLELALEDIYTELDKRLHESGAHLIETNRDLALAVILLVCMVLAVSMGLLITCLRLRRYSHSLRQLAMTDELTQLSNRRQWLGQVHRQLAMRQPPDSPVALLLLDLDHFKQVNDTFGHPTGDNVLAAFGIMLKRLARRGDLAARLGGEEFGLLLANSNAHSAEVVAERIRCETERFTLPEPAHRMQLTVSIGIAVSGHRDDDFSTLYRRADQALYSAKQEGRNCVRLG